MKPNIIVFMTDQQNANTIYDKHMAKTPNLSKFLRQSTTFTHAYCPAPHCCPSRATFFSGLYPSQHGVWNNVEVDNAISRGLYDDVHLFPEMLEKNGYETVFSGKWHVSAYEGPEKYGFHKRLNNVVTNFGLMKNENKPRSNEWDQTYFGGTPIDTEHEEKEFGRIIRPGYTTYRQFGVSEDPYGDKDTVSKACDEIMSYNFDEKPLFMYVGATGPHDPYYPPQQFLDMYDINEIELPENFYDDMLDKPALYRRTKEQFALSEEEHKESIRRYLAFVSYEDYLFGEILKSVDERGIRNNTIIIYLTDHGDYVGAHGLWAKGLPCFEEAYNICAAVSGPGIQKNQMCDELVSLADFAPTILDLAGVKSETSMIGKSLKVFLKGEQPKEWRTEIFTQTNGNEIYGIQRAVWNKKWKYVFNSFDYDELYNLQEDPLELNNVAKKEENKEIIKEMCKKMWMFAKETKDTCTCPYIMVGLAPYGPGIIKEEFSTEKK